ncbi:hypothetical protein [Nocardioides zeicaulis]|uniref:Uncharacterized protein n=1 Tax=Nocardioides zeicaulis TaxID=1776857 RepID=A0ABV6E2P3_9ACTN
MAAHPSPSQVFDPALHAPGSPGADGRCSHHEESTTRCDGEAVVSFDDGSGQWQSGCRVALEELVRAGRIEPLGQGA